MTPGSFNPARGGNLNALDLLYGDLARKRDERQTGPQPAQPRNALAADPDVAPQDIPEGASPQAYQELAKRIGLNEQEQAAAIQDFLATGGQNLDPTTTAWCAAAVNSALKASGKEGTGSLAARSFLDWGNPVDQPQIGDVAVFSRGDPSGWQGHVGFYMGETDDGMINVLGGNQGDAISVAPYSRDRLLGYRRG